MRSSGPKLTTTFSPTEISWGGFFDDTRGVARRMTLDEAKNAAWSPESVAAPTSDWRVTACASNAVRSEGSVRECPACAVRNNRKVKKLNKSS